MAKIVTVKKSRKEHICGGCGKVIPVGSPYQWISFNYGGTKVRCNKCGFKPYETTSNPYFSSVGKIVYDFDKSLEDLSSLEEAETLRDETVNELESLKEEQEYNMENLPEQFQYTGPGEIIQERIDALDNAIDSLDSIDFDLEEEKSEDIDEKIDKVKEEENLDENQVAHLRTYYDETDDEDSIDLELDDLWTIEQIEDKYEEWYEGELKEKLEEVKDELTEAISDLEY